MWRRFGIGADAALAGLLVSAAITLLLNRGQPLNLSLFAIGVSAPATAGLGVIVIALAIPDLVPHERLQRPSTYLLPAIHTALTLLCARMILTGPSAAQAVPEPLGLVSRWLSPVLLVALFVLSWLALEVMQRRPSVRSETERQPRAEG